MRTGVLAVGAAGDVRALGKAVILVRPPSKAALRVYEPTCRRGVTALPPALRAPLWGFPVPPLVRPLSPSGTTEGGHLPCVPTLCGIASAGPAGR